jgi:hypothetical protein
MPKGRIKEILHTADIAKSPGRRMCRGDRENHSIQPGDWFLRVKDGLGEKSYCLKCARVILDRGKVKLDKLVAKLTKVEQ